MEKKKYIYIGNVYTDMERKKRKTFDLCARVKAKLCQSCLGL